MTTIDTLVFIFVPVSDTSDIIAFTKDRPVCLSCHEYLGEYNMRQLCEKTTCVNTLSLEEIEELEDI